MDTKTIPFLSAEALKEAVKEKEIQCFKDQRYTEEDRLREQEEEKKLLFQANRFFQNNQVEVSSSEELSALNKTKEKSTSFSPLVPEEETDVEDLTVVIGPDGSMEVISPIEEKKEEKVVGGKSYLEDALIRKILKKQLEKIEVARNAIRTAIDENNEPFIHSKERLYDNLIKEVAEEQSQVYQLLKKEYLSIEDVSSPLKEKVKQEMNAFVDELFDIL